MFLIRKYDKIGKSRKICKVIIFLGFYKLLLVFALLYKVFGGFCGFVPNEKWPLIGSCALVRDALAKHENHEVVTSPLPEEQQEHL